MAYVKNKKQHFQLLYVLILLILPLLTLLGVEIIHRGSIVNTLTWITSEFLSFAITYLFILSLFFIFFILPRRYFVFMVFTFILLLGVFSFISYKKHVIRGDYFSPEDFMLIGEAAGILQIMTGIFTLKLLLLGLTALLLFAALYWLVLKLSVDFRFKKRLVFSLASLSVFIFILWNTSFLKIFNDQQYDLEEYYTKLGFIGGFTSIYNSIKASEVSDAQTINDSLLSVAHIANEEVDPHFTPNVIVVLAEALWDPLLLENIHFEKDPIPFTRNLMEEYSSGQLLTHVFGGGTINTEFEILTGFSTRFLPVGSETFHYNINRPIDSLAHNFKNQGYHTASVHNFKNWFYDRDKAYKHLGFEKFMSMEFFNNPEYIGPYIDDRELMRQVIKELQMTEGPDFLNVVTVSSHGPYDDIRYEEDIPIITSGELTQVPEYILNLYIQVLSELDDALQLLIEGVNELDEPTMVVIYGDHLPMLGYDYAVYREAEYFKSLNDYEDYLKMFSTPLIVWDNYSDGEREDLFMTPNFLGSYILAHAKKEMSPIFQVSKSVYDQGIHLIPKAHFLDEVDVDMNSLEEYKVIQQDSLMGKQYSYENHPVTEVEDYFLGSEKIVITTSKLQKSKQRLKIDLEGSGFLSNAKLFLNGKEIAYDYIDENHISSKEFFKSILQKDSNVVELKLYDDKDQVISTSNAFKLSTKNVEN